MHLRTLADTAAILAWHGTPPHPTSSDDTDAALRLFVINSRLLHDAWAPQLLKSRLADQPRTRTQLAEEILACELLSCSVAGYFQSAGPRLSRQQRITQHLRQANRDYRERAIFQVTAHAEVLSESLRIERLKRRLLQWEDRLLQPPCASHTGLEALLIPATSGKSGATRVRSWIPIALSLTVPNRVCTDPLRSILMQEMCSSALALIPACAYQANGVLKPRRQRLVERHGDFSIPSTVCESRHW